MININGLELVDIRSYTEIPFGFHCLIAIIIVLMFINIVVSIFMIFTECKNIKAICFIALLIFSTLADGALIKNIETRYTYPEYVCHIVGIVDTETLYQHYTIVSNQGRTVVLHPIMEEN